MCWCFARIHAKNYILNLLQVQNFSEINVMQISYQLRQPQVWDCSSSVVYIFGSLCISKMNLPLNIFCIINLRTTIITKFHSQFPPRVYTILSLYHPFQSFLLSHLPPVFLVKLQLFSLFQYSIVGSQLKYTAIRIGFLPDN